MVNETYKVRNLCDVKRAPDLMVNEYDFETYRDQNAEYIFKPIKDYRALGTLNDVFHSKFLRAMGEKAVENELTSGDGKRGLLSKMYCDRDASRIGLDAYKTVYHAENGVKCFQNLDLEKYIAENRRCEGNPEFRDDLIRAWLASSVTGNLDQIKCRNVQWYLPEDKTYRAIFAPNHDFEFCTLMADDEFLQSCQFYEMFKDAKTVIDRGFEPRNIDYLKYEHPEILRDFIDRLNALKGSPVFPAICDFQNLGEFFGTQQSKMDELSAQMYTGYKKRIDKMTDQSL